MVVIRLARHGGRKRPFYHVVVADKARALNGRFIEKLGYFNPIAQGEDVRLKLNIEQLEKWISQGAQPSSRVKSLMKEHKKQAAQ